jgi:hypothetical protein
MTQELLPKQHSGVLSVRTEQFTSNLPHSCICDPLVGRKCQVASVHAPPIEKSLRRVAQRTDGLPKILFGHVRGPNGGAISLDAGPVPLSGGNQKHIARTNLKSVLRKVIDASTSAHHFYTEGTAVRRLLGAANVHSK